MSTWEWPGAGLQSVSMVKSMALGQRGKPSCRCRITSEALCRRVGWHSISECKEEKEGVCYGWVVFCLPEFTWCLGPWCVGDERVEPLRGGA